MNNREKCFSIARYFSLFVAVCLAASSQTWAQDDANAFSSPYDYLIEHFIEPPKLRPCCAFGHDLRVEVGQSMVPVRIDNVLDPRRLGNHSYNERDVDTEMNGLIYSCKGGTLDIAHIRDYADWTAWLYARIGKVLGSSALIRLPAEAGHREILLRSFDLSQLPFEKRDELAVLIAQRIAFELAVWHEIATWYGHTASPVFSERLSAFSPEDHFSNALGAQIGAAALRRDQDFDSAVDDVLVETVYSMAPLLPGQTKKTFNMVDGIWWDRTLQLPDFRMVVRRNVAVGNTVEPWMVPDSHSPYCSGRNEKPAQVPIPETGPDGTVLTDLYELRFYVDRKEVPRFPLPENGHDWVSPEDYPYIFSWVKREVKEEFGPYGDKPGLTLEQMNAVPKSIREFDPNHPCGRADPDCSKTTREQAHGVKVGVIRGGFGNHPGPLVGATVAEITTPGGGIGVFDVNSAVNYNEGGYLLHIKAASTRGALFFCSEPQDNNPEETNVDWPFVNPFGTKCLPHQALGIELNILEFVTEENIEKIAIRPIEFGVVANLLRNGFSSDYLDRHLLWSFGIAPESIKDDDSEASPLRAYSRMTWESFHDDCRWGLKFFGQFRDDITHVNDWNTEGGARILYNILWSHADLRNGEAIHTNFAIVLEGGVEYWTRPENHMPGMMTFYFPPDHRYSSPSSTNDRFAAKAMIYLEMNIPTLGLF